jgi:hypothetical protein
MAVMTGDELRAVYHYARSLCVGLPFSTARENLLLLFEQNRNRWAAIITWQLRLLLLAWFAFLHVFETAWCQCSCSAVRLFAPSCRPRLSANAVMSDVHDVSSQLHDVSSQLHEPDSEKGSTDGL